MKLLLFSIFVLFGGGALAALTSRSHKVSTWIGSGSAIFGCAMALFGVASVALLSSEERLLLFPWNSQWGGSLALGIDGLSIFFLLPMLGLCLAAACYGVSYMLHWQGDKFIGLSWLYYNILIISMILVCLARNGMLFLIAWEVMALSSYLLVMFHDERTEVRKAGWIYLTAAHIGTAFLLVLFALLADGGSFDFDSFSATIRSGGITTNVAFLLALIGFGAKAGLVPLHVWLPEAHPAAPSHVSAVMSGVMIKTGIYGLLRILVFLGEPPSWWGWLLVIIGAISGVMGVLFAIAQHDLKRLLAYSSVENIGIVFMGLGLGLIGWNLKSPAIMALGLAGGLLHVINHTIFKGLLFMGAGAVGHAVGSLDIDHLGGLGKRMPQTAVCFFVGAAAISGFPPLNGFISEFTILLGSYHSILTSNNAAIGTGIAIIISLGLIGGLAAACFAKAFGMTFLGEPRNYTPDAVHEAPVLMCIPMLLLAAACVIMGLSGPVVLPLIGNVIVCITKTPYEEVEAGLLIGINPLKTITFASGVFIALVAALAYLRHRLLSNRKVEQTVTWDCGYALPTPRMQYTGSSFVDPIVRMFEMPLGTRRDVQNPVGFFPQTARLMTHTPDLFIFRFYDPVIRIIRIAASKLHCLQHGRIQFYILYIAMALLALLLWKL
ncbi:MAG: proton-conducting transporter membrane subunit [Pseudomonadota bacterium]